MKLPNLDQMTVLREDGQLVGVQGDTYLEEFLIPSATVEDLLHEYFLIGVSKLSQRQKVKYRSMSGRDDLPEQCTHQHGSQLF